MTQLNMISLPVDMRAFNNCAAARGFGEDEGLALHHMLSEAFGKSAIQPFRLMASKTGATLYSYTQKSKEELNQTREETCTPDLLQVFGTSPVASKPMPAAWPLGRTFAFDVRVRPVRRLAQPLKAWSRSGDSDPMKKGAEVDAYLVDVMRRFPEGKPSAHDEKLWREGVYRDWLSQRIKGAGLIVENTRMKSYERSRLMRGSTGIEGPEVIFHGELKITDSALFSKTLASGIGRHSAYGFGMMLLRPARG